MTLLGDIDAALKSAWDDHRLEPTYVWVDAMTYRGLRSMRPFQWMILGRQHRYFKRGHHARRH